MNNIVVIGGGAAGMMAAVSAWQAGAKVTLLEKNEKLGKKLYITGKGRCNVTNDCTQEEFLREVPSNPRFLYGALAAFNPEDMKAFLLQNGCPVKTERGRRVFPVSDHASDVTTALSRALKNVGADVRMNTAVKQITITDGHVSGVVTADGKAIPADKVIVATGGLSYPSTGSTGDGYLFAKAAGLTVTETAPSLVPMTYCDPLLDGLTGLQLKNVTLTAKAGKKTLYSELGEMSFLRGQLAGPLVIELSSHLHGQSLENVLVTLDLKPGLTDTQLENRLLRDFCDKQTVTDVLRGLLPAQMANVFARLLGASAFALCAQATKEQREHVKTLLKAFPLPITGYAPIEEAIVTHGGVSVKEISPKTMEAKRVSGLYFAGEVLDVDAHTGGYNLQIAFSTGMLAGKSAAEDERWEFSV